MIYDFLKLSISSLQTDNRLSSLNSVNFDIESQNNTPKFLQLRENNFEINKNDFYRIIYIDLVIKILMKINSTFLNDNHYFLFILLNFIEISQFFYIELFYLIF